MADPNRCVDHDVIKLNMKYIKDSVTRTEEKLDAYITEAKTEYSAKWVEKLVTVVLSTTGMIIIGALLGLIIAPKAFAYTQILALNI